MCMGEWDSGDGLHDIDVDIVVFVIDLSPLLHGFDIVFTHLESVNHEIVSP